MRKKYSVPKRKNKVSIVTCHSYGGKKKFIVNIGLMVT